MESLNIYKIFNSHQSTYKSRFDETAILFSYYYFLDGVEIKNFEICRQKNEKVLHLGRTLDPNVAMNVIIEKLKKLTIDLDIFSLTYCDGVTNIIENFKTIFSTLQYSIEPFSNYFMLNIDKNPNLLHLVFFKDLQMRNRIAKIFYGINAQ